MSVHGVGLNVQMRNVSLKHQMTCPMLLLAQVMLSRYLSAGASWVVNSVIVDTKLSCDFELRRAKHQLRYRLLLIRIGGGIFIYLKMTADEHIVCI